MMKGQVAHQMICEYFYGYKTLDSTDMIIHMNRLFSNSYGPITTKEWNCLQDGEWANDDVIMWCAK